MANSFDHITFQNDSVFSSGSIGQLQCKQAWSYVQQIMPCLPGLEMLELNTGFGDDALMFSNKDINIIATDVSEEMQKVTQQRTKQYSMQSNISSHYIDIESFDEMLFNKKFDLIFSNFSGLNYISPESLKIFFEKIPSLLSPKGRFIALIMPKYCIWETCYFLLRFNFKKAFQRFSSPVEIKSDNDSTSKLWFYSPSQIKEWAEQHFKIVSIKPVGLALPPLALNGLFAKRKKLLLRLNAIEKKLNKVSSYSGLADHFIIDLQRK